MSRKPAHGPVAILATIAAASSIGVATAAQTAAEPYNVPINTSRQMVKAIPDPNKIFPGQVINIPKPPKTYVVQRGDTLSGIAKKYGISLAALEAANRSGSRPAGLHQTRTGSHPAGWHRARTGPHMRRDGARANTPLTG